MKIKKHFPKCGFPFIYMNDACYCTDAGGNDMKTLNVPYHMMNSAIQEFADFDVFPLKKKIEKIFENNGYIVDIGKEFQTFLVNEVIDRIEKESFTLKCSVRAMAFLETLYCYSRIKTGVGVLTLASCDIILEVDFKLAEYTIIYELYHWRTEEPLLRFIIAE